MVKIVTINILSDLSHWAQRCDLLAQGIAALAPDVVAIQEVRLPENTAAWLAKQIGLPYVHLSPKVGWESSREAIAILSRLPLENNGTLDLGGQRRVAQFVQVSINDRPLVVANGHFYWQPGESPARLQQVERLMSWLAAIPGSPPCVVCGDFNGTPETSAIQRMREKYVSAYSIVHGKEPDYTCPTPLPRSRIMQVRTLLGFFLLIRPRYYNLKWKGTLDYIFVDPRLHVTDCQVVLDQPASANPKIYPSDHFGLCAFI
jgi:endonuclease/exonuclease/phosphatase family metal-dependent hydrolase